jgi:hypothetical protein
MRHCPHLIEISITVVDPLQIPDQVSSRGLFKLHLQYTPLKQYIRLARYIDALFPHLSHFAMSKHTSQKTVRGIIFDVCQAV